MERDGLPWRPMTISELLDASVSVLRRRPVQLLGVAAVLAALEQVVLYPLRHNSPGNRGFWSDLFTFQHNTWTVLAIGMGTEAFILGVLGAFAAVSARALLLASTVPSPALPNPTAKPPARRLVAATVLSAFVGIGAFATFWAGGVPWVFWFMFTALVTPTLVNDAALGARSVTQPGRRLSMFGAFGRSFALVGRSGLRPGGVRILSYLVFLVIRVIVAWAGIQELFTLVAVPAIGKYAIWVIVNATMYACIACGDAATHLEARIRLEGLDIALNRAVRTGRPVADALVVPR